jgi:hypothetical protein
MRVVGNDISCPLGDGQTGFFAAALSRRRVLLEVARKGKGVSPVPPLPLPPSGMLREAKQLGSAK